MKEPLAFRLRPKSLDDIIGQEHLVGPDQILRRFIKEKRLFSTIFFGPPGTGKTTLASCLANELGLPYRLFNAVTGNKKDLDAIFLEAQLASGLVVIVDEVHRLNKDKQDLLLPHIENGSITLLGATTSNPYFAINPAIRSRCQLLEVKSLSSDQIKTALFRALNHPLGLENLTLSDDAAEIIAQHSNGDIRYALNILEICALASDQSITKELVLQYSQFPNSSMSASDDGYYDALSAFQKSIRGSDVDAALYYLARLIQAGDLDSIERRLLVIAYEDIGLANPAAVARVCQAVDTARKVGFPEASIPLSVAIIDLCLSPKSRSACAAISEALAEVQSRSLPVPDYLRLTPVSLKPEDKYDYSRSDIWPKLQYLPEAIKDAQFFSPTPTSSYEKQLAQNWSELKKSKRTNNIAQLKKKEFK
ncbi:MAG: replication-associated recombination protein A [Anaerorhabdus sp.]